MRPAEPDLFEAIPVSDRVNKVANDDPALVHPALVAPEPVVEKKQKPKTDQLNLF